MYSSTTNSTSTDPINSDFSSAQSSQLVSSSMYPLLSRCQYVSLSLSLSLCHIFALEKWAHCLDMIELTPIEIVLIDFA